MKTVFFDVDTQVDFLFPAGGLYAPGAERIVPQLERLTKFAVSQGIPIISTLDTHAEDDPEFRQYNFHPHCVEGTAGHAKAQATLAGSGQHFIKKHTFDCFTSPELKPLLEKLGAERYVVYGVVTEICVQCAAIGLLNTGARVELVTDAVRSLDEGKAQAFLAEFGSRGGRLVTVAEAV